MLGDPNKEIRQQADTALADFLREIQNQPNTDLGSMIPILVRPCSKYGLSFNMLARITSGCVSQQVTHCKSKDDFSKEIALNWIQTFIEQGQEGNGLQLQSLLRSLLQLWANALPAAPARVIRPARPLRRDPGE